MSGQTQEGFRMGRDRLYVIAFTHRQFVCWCRERGLSPRDPALAEVGPWNYRHRLLGVRGARCVLLDWFDGAPTMPGLHQELRARFAEVLSGAEADGLAAELVAFRAASARAA